MLVVTGVSCFYESLRGIAVNLRLERERRARRRGTTRRMMKEEEGEMRGRGGVGGKREHLPSPGTT
jgi:hypothetical protein